MSALGASAINLVLTCTAWFLSIEAGSTGAFPCYWMANKHMAEGGGFWIEAHGDLWPAKPTLWKPMSSNV